CLTSRAPPTPTLFPYTTLFRSVPRLVEHAAAVRTIACLPLHAGPTPVGSLVLVAVAPRSFAERDVRTLERPLAELALMIEAVRRDRKSTRLNSSHVSISYAVFC